MNIQLKKGTLELCVLSLLSKVDMYGFELVGKISTEIKVSEGTIYPLLKRIKDEGYVTTYLRESQEGPPRKYYSITDHGRQTLATLTGQWKDLVTGINKIICNKRGGNKMTRHNFFKELKRAITNVPNEALDDIIYDLNEHFDAGLEDGLSESEICKNLGQPGSIAEQINEEFRDSSQAGGSGHAPLFVGENDEGFVDEIFDGISEVYVHMKASDIHFERENRSDFRVVIKGKSKYNKYTIENKNGRLEVVEHEQMARFFPFSFTKSVETTVYVPSQFNGSITAKSAAGNIKAKDLTSPITLSSSAGNVSVERHLSDSADLSTSAGNIDAEFFGRIALCIHTKAGSIKLKANETSELILNSGAGSVKAEIDKLSGNSKLSSGAGSIKLNAYDIEGEIKLSSGAGSIRAYLPEDSNINIKLKKSSVGSIKSEIKGNDSSPHTLKAQTGAGSIKILRL